MYLGAPEVDVAMSRLEQSDTFARAGGLLRLLRFLMEHADSPDDGAKETYIGAVFYGRAGTYDPRYDSIVRVSVKRLRTRLLEYYAVEGKDDPVRIVIPLGSYRAVLETVEAAVAEVVVEPERVVEPVPEARGRLWWMLALGSMCLILIGLGVRWERRGPPPPFAVTRNLSSWPLTPGRDIETDASVSPDGKTLAYVTRRPGGTHFQIFLRALKATDQMGTALDTGGGDALRPAWSRDGTMLAFLRCGIGPCEIAVIPAAGGATKSIRVLPRAVLRDDQPYYWTRQQRPIWTADGKALIFPDRDQADDREALVRYDLSTGTEQTLTTGEKSDEEGAAALAPDGRTVAFVRVNLDSAEILTLDLMTLQQKVVAAHWDVHTNGLAWSPDGRGVLISRQKDARWEPWWVPLEGSPRLLSVNLPEVMNPVFGSEGKTVIATSVNLIQNVVMATEGLGQTGPQAAPQVLFRTMHRDSGAKFSPDGTRVAFLSNRSGRNELWVADVAAAGASKFTSQPAQLTHHLPASATMSFSWAPDGSSFLVGMHGDRGTMEAVDARTGSWSLMKIKGLETSLLYCPIWSEDGRWIYASASGAQSGVMRIAPDGSVAPALLAEGRTYGIQLDGDRYLYFDSWVDNGISRIALGVDKPQIEAIPELATVLASRKWLIVEGGLYYLDFHDEERKLRRFDLATRAMTAVTGTLPSISFGAPTLTVLPKRHVFLYSQWDENTGSQIVELRPN